MTPLPELPVPGVRALEHTADLGLEVDAPDPAALFERAALGMVWLLDERPPPEPTLHRSVVLTAPDLPALLRAWLREILLWHEMEGFAPSSATFTVLEDARLEAEVRGGAASPAPVREIKGVTLHALAAEARNQRWWARVIFDV
ncbi:MAG: archease [Gemmatimonadetes bacterium]|nr:archease [Gemmatimonadota bacterium]